MLTEIVAFRVDKALSAVIDRLAAREDRTRSQWARRLFLKALLRETTKPEPVK